MGNLEPPIIVAQNLSKVYRLYAKSHYRMMDMFGLLKNKHQAYTEHAALDNINLQVNRGEKVAIIGRNGAGKSTLLKIITNVIRPTSGTIDVDGKVHALLQIGTGFHPEFTGRENVYGYLAQLGLTGKEADQKVREVIEFAELEEYIDQPMKTYSTGMGVRLMFSTSTAITPNLLVLDEVMGVGDSYFSQKSYDRMKELCEGQGTTLLMVTHDVYSAAKICNRAIWIDRGKVLIDGESKTVVKAYEDSIRQQEEERLRIKSRQLFLSAQEDSNQQLEDAIFLEFRCEGRIPQSVPIYFSKVSLCIDKESEIILPLGQNAFSKDQKSYLIEEGSNWGDFDEWQGRDTRSMLNYGSSFHKVCGVFGLPWHIEELQGKILSISADYWTQEKCSLGVYLFIQEQEISIGKLSSKGGGWSNFEAEYSLADIGQYSASAPFGRKVNSTGFYGTGAISILDIFLVDSRGKEQFVFSYKEPLSVVIKYKINEPDLRGNAQVMLAFKRNGVQDVCRSMTRELFFDEAKQAQGSIVATFQEFGLAEGVYTITAMITEENYFDKEQSIFFSINPGVYCCIDKAIQFEISRGGIVGKGTGVVLQANWEIKRDKARELVATKFLSIVSIIALETFLLSV